MTPASAAGESAPTGISTGGPLSVCSSTASSSEGIAVMLDHLARFAGCNRVRKPRKLRPEPEVLPYPATLEHRLERARTFRVRAVGRRLPHRREEGGEVGGFVVDQVVDAMRRGPGIE